MFAVDVFILFTVNLLTITMLSFLQVKQTSLRLLKPDQGFEEEHYDSRTHALKSLGSLSPEVFAKFLQGGPGCRWLFFIFVQQ